MERSHILAQNNTYKAPRTFSGILFFSFRNGYTTRFIKGKQEGNLRRVLGGRGML